MKTNQFKFTSEVWIYPSETAAWYFISVPKEISKVIKAKYGKIRRGWGSIPVLVSTGKTKWLTSIFPYKENESYILPLKNEVRKKEKILERDKIYLEIKIQKNKKTP